MGLDELTGERQAEPDRRLLLAAPFGGTLEAIEDNLMSMVDLAHANGINVVFSSVMPVCDYIRPQTERRPPAKIGHHFRRRERLCLLARRPLPRSPRRG